MKVTTSLLTASIFLLPAVFVGGASSRDDSALQEKISDTLHQMYEAEKRKDLNFVLSHLSDDFAEVAGDAQVYHRSDIEAGWTDVTLKDYRLSDCIFKLMTRDVAYLSCIVEVNATYKGQPFPQHIRVTTVWTQRKGAWLIRFEQGTVFPEQKKVGKAELTRPTGVKSANVSGGSIPPLLSGAAAPPRPVPFRARGVPECHFILTFRAVLKKQLYRYARMCTARRRARRLIVS